MESKPDFEGFEYPIQSFLEGLGHWRVEKVLNPNEPLTRCVDSNDPEPTELLNYDLFEKVIFAQEGENDGDSWIIVALHQNGYYILFDASCDYTGFDCQGGGLLLYTKSANDMFEYGFDQWTRDLIPEFLEHAESDLHL